MLFTIAQFTVFVFTFNKFDNYLVQELFTSGTREMKSAESTHKLHKRQATLSRLSKCDISEIDQKLNAKKVSPLKDLINHVLPQCLQCLCLKKSRQQRLFESARILQIEELEITHLIRMIRLNDLMIKLCVKQQADQTKNKIKRTIKRVMSFDLDFIKDSTNKNIIKPQKCSSSDSND